MGKYNFDEVIERRGTDTVKYERLERYFGRNDLMAMWIADMEFKTPPFVVDALKKRIEHPVFGYAITPDDYFDQIATWLFNRHQWQVDTSWLTYIPGIVRGIGMVLNVFTKPGDKVIIQTPVYHPFRLVPEGLKREVVSNPLHRNEDGSYSMDFENLAQVADEKCKVLILSNPHNPAGIVWDKDTLVRLAHFCKEHKILVISDEIHCDMALFGHKHLPFAMCCEEAAQNSITFGAPTKTFNIAGIVSSYAIVPNNHIREQFYSWLEAFELNEPAMFSTLVTQAAFTAEGNEWREEMLRYLESNVEFVEQYCRENMPQIKPMRPQASFLVWLDCTALGLDHEALNDLFINKAHLALNDGEMFGPGGAGFMRFNIGEPRSMVLQALQQLKQAIDTLI